MARPEGGKNVLVAAIHDDGRAIRQQFQDGIDGLVRVGESIIHGAEIGELLEQLLEVDDFVSIAKTPRRLPNGEMVIEFTVTVSRESPDGPISRTFVGPLLLALQAAVGVIELRRCGQCEEVKSLELFARAKQNASGRSYRCRACESVRICVYQKKKKEQAKHVYGNPSASDQRSSLPVLGDEPAAASA